MSILTTSTVYQVVLIGDSSVGKTSLVYRYTKEGWIDTKESVGVDLVLKLVQVDGNPIKLQIWDTVGMERFDNIQIPFWRRADGIAIVYDLTKRQSFESVNRWIQRIRDNVINEGLAIILIANKCDSPDRVVSKKEQEDFARRVGYVLFETSAKENINVSESFQALANQIYKKRHPNNDNKEIVRLKHNELRPPTDPSSCPCN